MLHARHRRKVFTCSSLLLVGFVFHRFLVAPKRLYLCQLYKLVNVHHQHHHAGQKGNEEEEKEGESVCASDSHCVCVCLIESVCVCACMRAWVSQRNSVCVCEREGKREKFSFFNQTFH